VTKVSGVTDDVMARIDSLRAQAEEMREAMNDAISFDRVSDLLRDELRKLEGRAVTAINEKKSVALAGIQDSVDTAQNFVSGWNDRLDKAVGNLFDRVRVEIMSVMLRAEDAAISLSREVRKVRDQVQVIYKLVDQAQTLVDRFDSAADATVLAIDIRGAVDSALSTTAISLLADEGSIASANADFSVAVDAGSSFFEGLATACGGLRKLANAPYTPAQFTLPSRPADRVTSAGLSAVEFGVDVLGGVAPDAAITSLRSAATAAIP